MDLPDRNIEFVELIEKYEALRTENDKMRAKIDFARSVLSDIPKYLRTSEVRRALDTLDKDAP